jgi:PmbA protein
MDRGEREELSRHLLALSAADETEVVVASSDTALARFTHEAFNQSVATVATEIAVRAIVDGRSGVASSNLQRDDPRSLVERAIAMARLSPRDPALPPLPVGRIAAAPPNAFVAATAHATPEDRARRCAAVFESAEGAGCWCAGYAATGSAGVTIANTNGALSSFDGTDAAINAKMIGSDASGWAEVHASDIALVDGADVGRRAALKARANASPRSADPGEWTVILEPAAFGELLAYLAPHFSAQMYDEGSSFCSDGLDRRYFAENVSIFEDYAHPLHPGMPFDFEGYPTQRLALVENGVVRNVVTDSYYAKKLGRNNTGHALPAPNAYGPQTRNVVVGAGGATLDELIATTRRAILVTRFWYIRTVDHKKAIVTGMTRDGTMLVEDGRIVCGLRNLRFNQSILEVLRSCELSCEQRRTASYGYDLVVPAARVERFRFTSGTEF